MSSTFLSRLDRRLHTIFEVSNTSYRSPHSNENYDRQHAEDCLYHTIGPLTENPRWLPQWTSRTQPPADFNPGGPAPRWTPEEVIYAMAGDPNMLFKSSDNPRSPSYGNMGGAPLFRLAKKVARIYGRGTDKQLIADFYSNGFVPLVRMMQPGFDESRSPFIAYVMRNVQGAMEHGIGGTEQGIHAAGGHSETGLIGLRGMLDSNNPQQVREMANQVKGKFQTQRSHDKHPDNPFGQYSSRYYQLGMAYADALESGDEEKISAIRNQIEQLKETIDDDKIPVLGASTGIGQAISTQDRTSSIGVSSMDVEKGEGEGSAAGNVPSDDHLESDIGPESIQFIFNIALKHDIGKIVGHLPKYRDMAINLGAKTRPDGSANIGGVLTANELRYVVRVIGELGSNYPGVGNLRANTSVPRDAPGWWRPGEDPEIEPIPGKSAIWHSIWSRNNYQPLGPTEIAAEMTEEVREFAKLGIPTARTVKAKAKVDEAVSKVAVANTTKAAIIKLKVIAAIHKSQLGLDEAIYKSGFPLLEGIDKYDRTLIENAYDFILRKLNQSLIREGLWY